MLSRFTSFNWAVIKHTCLCSSVDKWNSEIQRSRVNTSAFEDKLVCFCSGRSWRHKQLEEFSGFVVGCATYLQSSPLETDASNVHVIASKKGLFQVTYINHQLSERKTSLIVTSLKIASDLAAFIALFAPTGRSFGNHRFRFSTTTPSTIMTHHSLMQTRIINTNVVCGMLPACLR